MIINVYYESLEQGLHYIKENLYQIDPEITVNLIKKRSQSCNRTGYAAAYSKSISSILLRKNPDLIISTVIDDVEYPLAVIEFSTAVFTKDHEQQRADNFLIPIQNDCVYIKVSPKEKLTVDSGGDTSYNYLEPFALVYQHYNEICFHINWEVEEGNKRFVKKSRKFMSLPDNNLHIILLLREIIYTLKENGISNWKQSFFKKIEASETFKEWVDTLRSFNDFEDYQNINSSRTQYFEYYPPLKRNNVFILKLNRMGHAMDPERGMLVYYNKILLPKNTITVARFIFRVDSKTWYKSTPAENYISNDLLNYTFISAEKLLEYFCRGLSLCDQSLFLKITSNSSVTPINIDEYIEKNYTFFNNSFRTLVECSDFIELTDGVSSTVHLTWTRKNYGFDLSLLPNKTVLQNRVTISEDDITYITLHNVFMLNDIQPISVSYPGAQSDTPILPDPTAGRRQQRIYIDNIGCKNNTLILQENKGCFKKAEIVADIRKIVLFKESVQHKDAITLFKNNHKIEGDEIVIGVGFGESNVMARQLHEVGIDNVDYFLIISQDLLSWKLFSNINNDEIFKIKSGVVAMPMTFEVDRYRNTM